MTFLASTMFRLACGASIIAALVVWRATDLKRQQALGAERAIAKIEKATDNAIDLGTKAAEKSVAPVVAGNAVKRVRPIRDPTARDN